MYTHGQDEFFVFRTFHRFLDRRSTVFCNRDRFLFIYFFVFCTTVAACRAISAWKNCNFFPPPVSPFDFFFVYLTHTRRVYVLYFTSPSNIRCAGCDRQIGVWVVNIQVITIRLGRWTKEVKNGQKIITATGCLSIHLRVEAL
jgi:hypothetical protein